MYGSLLDKMKYRGTKIGVKQDETEASGWGLNLNVRFSIDLEV